MIANKLSYGSETFNSYLDVKLYMSEIRTRKGLKGVSEGNSTVILERSTKVKI